MPTSIYETHLKIKNGEVSALELTENCLSVAVKNSNNSYISVLAEQARKNASSVDAEIKKSGVKSYLHGIPYSLKDLFVTKGIRTTAGSKILYNYIPPYEGYVSKQLKKSGGILIGKNGCDEFGMGSTNENTVFRPVNFPGHDEYVPGGSSGGSTVSVLEKSCFYSIGTDTGGSVRLPSNFCGLTGFKPTYGRVSRFGQIAYGSSLDQASPIANNVTDLAIIMEHLTENDEKDSTQAPLGALKCVEKVLNAKADLKGKTIGFDPELINGCRGDVKKELEAAMKQLKDAGATFKEISLPHLKHSVAVYYIIATSEASSNLARFDGIHYGLSDKEANLLEDVYIKSRSEGFGSEVIRRILLGTFSLSAGYSDEYFAKACKIRRLIYNDFQNAFKQCDVVFSPVCATTSFKTSEKLSPLQLYMTDLYTIPVNLAGLPSVALPWGTSKLNNLPTGFQLIGQSFGDVELLEISASAEKVRKS